MLPDDWFDYVGTRGHDLGHLSVIDVLIEARRRGVDGHALLNADYLANAG
ncbi:hypothetical protein [Nocardia sp. NPDC055049]